MVQLAGCPECKTIEFIEVGQNPQGVMFFCSKCRKQGPRLLTATGAAVGWNEMISGVKKDEPSATS